MELQLWVAYIESALYLTLLKRKDGSAFGQCGEDKVKWFHAKDGAIVDHLKHF